MIAEIFRCKINGDAIALWIRLRLPSCFPVFQSKHTISALINIFLNCVMWKIGWDWPIKFFIGDRTEHDIKASIVVTFH